MKTKSIMALLVVVSLFFVLPAQAKTFNFKLSVMHGPKASKNRLGDVPWSKAVEKATKGKVKITIYTSSSLSPAKEVFDNTINGIVDIGFMSLNYFPGRFPLTESFNIPGLGITTASMFGEIAWKSYNKYPEMQAEFKQVKLLFLIGFAPMVIASKDKPIRRWEDLRNFPIRVGGKGGAQLMKIAGAAPMAMTPSEIFLALQKGVIGASCMGLNGHQAFGVMKIAKYYTVAPAMPGVLFAFVMNKQKFDSMPTDIQKDFLSVCGEYAMKLYARGDDKTDKILIDKVLAAGHELIRLSPEENRRWCDYAKPIQEERLRKIEKKGLPARALFNDIVRMVKEYQ